MFRTARAAEILSTSGYPLEGYALLRSVREQAFGLAAVANRITTMAALQGQDVRPEASALPIDRRKIEQARINIEKSIRRGLMSEQLDEETAEELKKWDWLFHQQVHGSQLTRAIELERVLKGGSDFSIGPVPTEMADSMYMNRAHEMGWMIVRLLPFLQLEEAPFTPAWKDHWLLMDKSFRFIIEGLDFLGKEIARAFFKFIDLKFRFTPDLRYFE
jgi:hypothetical protein